MLKIRQQTLAKILKRLDEGYALLIDENEQPFFRERAEMLYKEFLFRLALVNIPIERENGMHILVQPQARRATFLTHEEHELDQINALYTLAIVGDKDAQETLDAAIIHAKEAGMEVTLKPGRYDFANQFHSIFDIIPPYVHKMNTQKPVESLEEKG